MFWLLLLRMLVTLLLLLLLLFCALDVADADDAVDDLLKDAVLVPLDTEQSEINEFGLLAFLNGSTLRPTNECLSFGAIR